ncbi:MAG: PAS domain S-box protein, partial [Gemmatimonadetes bacterium]|nr:PAS domain S-box protein [Gemmatimonadota bacterium]
TDLVATTDAHGRVLYLNRAGRRMLAIPEDEEITSLTISDMHPYGEPALLISEGIGAALREGVWSGETLLLARDGRQIPVSEVILAHNTAAGQLEFLSLIIRDISERKRAEEELRQSEEHFRSLIENVSDIITVLGPLGDIRYASPSVERVLGYAPEELVGASAFDFSHPEDVPSIQAGLAESMRQPRATASFEFRFRHKNGSWRMLEATGKSTLHHPTTAGAVINARDVTERQEMQTLLHQSQKMDAVGRLAGGVAHDFNNLLTAIKGHCSLLLMDLRPQDPMRLSIEEIDKASDRAASLTQQLLAFSRRQVLQPRVLDLNGVVTETEMMLRRLIGEDIELVVHRDPRLGSIKADPGQIGQVLVNLAVNARDAMPAGGKLTIETRDLELDEEHTRRHAGMRAGSYVLLVVRDTGCGMDEDTLSHVFEPFFTTKEQSRGTGLGLSTVYGIIKQSAGYIWVTSEPGQGTTFEIYLPRTAEAAPGSADSNAEPAAPYGSALYGSETVLLVEDEHAVRALVRRVLERNGYSVLEAPDGAAALRLTQQYDREIHLLISDVVMPEMGGHQLAESLSRLRPAMRVLFMSGYSEDAILHHVVLEPGTDFLAKPFTPDALARTVRQVLDAPTAKPGDTPA